MRKGERKLLKDSIIQYVKENTAKISLEELDTVLTAEAIAGYFQVKRNTVSYYLNQEIGKTFFKINRNKSIWVLLSNLVGNWRKGRAACSG